MEECPRVGVVVVTVSGYRSILRRLQLEIYGVTELMLGGDDIEYRVPRRN